MQKRSHEVRRAAIYSVFNHLIYVSRGKHMRLFLCLRWLLRRREGQAVWRMAGEDSFCQREYLFQLFETYCLDRRIFGGLQGH